MTYRQPQEKATDAKKLEYATALHVSIVEVSRLFDSNVFGQSIRRMRKAAGKNQEKFASLIDATGTYMSNIEGGLIPSLGTANKIAETLGVELAELFEEPAEQEGAFGARTRRYSAGAIFDRKRELAVLVNTLFPKSTPLDSKLEEVVRKKAFGAKLESLMHDIGMSPELLASMTSGNAIVVTSGDIILMMEGQKIPSTTVFRRLLNALGCSKETFFNGQEPEPIGVNHAAKMAARRQTG
ncbi:MAG TPA: helix-turn-helix transcriptional regulator [Candidatus Saccharimonadales bacterium]|nr:helix-turn-helix transcriptional regulator [Candidatus Saccharimonadales bacterium]